LKNDSISIGGLRAVSVSPINSDQVFAGGGYVTSTGVLTGAVYKSSNASSVDAVSWTRVLPSEVGAITGQYIKSIAQPWGNTNIVLAADSINGIYRSTDNGSTWSLLSNTTGATYVYFDPMHKDTAFAVRNNGGSWLILKSFDGGATFTALTQGFLYPITSVSMDSAYTQYLYVTTWGGGVYRSTNLGTTFTQINNGTLNLNVFSLSVNKDTSNLFIGTEFGLYRSNNRGTSWIDNNTGGAGFGIDKVYDVYSTRDTVWSVLGTKGHFRMDKSAGTYSWTHESLNTVEYPISYEASTDSMMFRDLDFIWKWTEGPSYTNVGYSVSESKAVYRTKSQVAGGTFPILNNGAAVAATANSDTVYVWLSDTSSAIRGEYTDIPVYIKNGAIVDSFRVAIHLPRYINGSTGAYEFLVDTIITDGTLSSGRTLSRFGVEAGDSTYVIQSASTTKLAGDGILFKLRVRAYALAASADSLPRAPHNNIYSADSAIFIWNGRAWPTTNYTNWTFTGAGAYDSTDFGYNDNGVKIPRQCGSAPGYIDSLAHFWFRKLPNMDYSGLNGLESSNNFIVYANPGDRAGTSTDYNDNNFSTERLWQYTKNTGRSMIVGIPNTAKITYPFLTYGTQSGSIGGTLYTGPFPEKEIRTGDAIGAFYYRDDSLVCAGWGTWDPAIGSVFTVWGDDDRTPLKDGFVTNEKLILKVYDSRYKVVWNVNNQTVKNGNIFFTDNGVSKFDTLEAKYYPRLLLPILAGWNLISSYLIPAQPEVENIFKSGVVGNRFILMKDENGLVYWPQIGLNQIINWDITKAYWVYYYQVKLQDHNGIYGPPVDITKNTINLHKGWNLLPYWGDQLVAPSTVLASIAGKFTLLKDGTGRIYWPEVGYCDIDNMWAGFGYEIFMTEAAVFKFPSSVSSMSIRSFNTGRGIPEITESNGEVYKYHAKVSPVSQVIGFAFSDYNMKSGDEIGVFTKDGLCVGSAKYRKNCDNIVVVIVFGDITVTKKDAKSGAADGDELVFKLFTKADGKEYTPVANSINWKIGSGSVTFKANTIGSVNLSAKGNTHPVLPLEFALQQNYPNPFNPATNIKYALPVDGLVKIRVYDMLGREIKTLVSTQQSAGYYTVEWDATNNMGCKVASGVYFYQIEASGFSKTFKMMLMK
jgi:hypothetical protein